MGQLTLTLEDGRTGTVDIDNGFASLPPDKQAATIADIKSQLSSHPSFGADLQGGLHDAMIGLAQGAHTLGGVASRNGLPGIGDAVSGAGDWLQSNAPAAPAGPSPGQTLASDLKAGNYSNLPGDIAHAAVRAAPSVLPVIAGGAVGSLAGPMGAAAGAGLASGAMSLGPNAYGRAANNGRSEPTTADLEGSFPATAVDAGIGALTGGEGSATGPIRRALLNVGKGAALVGGTDAANQLGTSVGTDKGTQFDPYETAGAALSGGVIGGAASAPRLAGGAVKAGSDQLMAKTLTPPSSPDDAASVMRVNQAMDAAKTGPNASGGPISDTRAANVVKNNLATGIKSDLAQLQGAGMIDRPTVSSLSQQITAQAERHNNNASQELFDRIAALGLPDLIQQRLSEQVRDLNTVSTNSFINATVGPFQRLGNVAGQVGGIAAGAMSGNPVELAGAIMGHSIAGKIGGGLGSVADRFLGTNTPTVRLQAINAARMLRDVGIDPSTVAPSPSVGDSLAATPQPPQPSIPRQAEPGFAPKEVVPPSSPALPAYGLIPPPPPTAADAPSYQPIKPPTPGPLQREALPGYIKPTSLYAVPEPSYQPPPRSPSAPLNAARMAIGVGPATFRQAPDPVTGNLPDPVPVNTAIRPPPNPGATPTGGANLPPLRIDTPADVRAAVAQDTPIGQPNGVWSGGHSFIAAGDPMRTAEQMHTASAAAEAAGKVPPGTTAQLASGQMARIAPAVADTIRSFMGGPDVVKAAANRVRNPLSYKANLDQEASIATNIVAQHPELREVVNAIRDPSANGKTKDGRAATLQAYLATIPDPAERSRQEQILSPLTSFGQ